MSRLTRFPARVTMPAITLRLIGMDRSVGYGLKYANAFKHTHLGEV